MRIMLLIALALIPLSVTACPPSSTHRVICREPASDDLAMDCERWAMMVGAAHKLGAQRYLVMMKNYVQDRPPAAQRWMMLFSMDAAAFVAQNDFPSADQAANAALVVCGRYEVS